MTREENDTLVEKLAGMREALISDKHSIQFGSGFFGPYITIVEGLLRDLGWKPIAERDRSA